MNELFLKDLADKTRRGLRGRVEAGKSGGGICYGCRVARSLGPDGAVTGERTIDAAEAQVVVRIFEEFAAGVSPQATAKRLNREGIPGPGGRTWGPSTIHGHALRGTGVLNNELYVGRIVWNRQRYLKPGDRTTRVGDDKRCELRHALEEPNDVAKRHARLFPVRREDADVDVFARHPAIPAWLRRAAKTTGR